MRCDRAQQLYDEYSRGSLPPATMARLEEHLAASPPCRETFELNDQIARLMRRATDVAHPGPQYFDDLTARVLDRLDAGERPVGPLDGGRGAAPWRRPLWWSGFSAAAALLALAVFPPPDAARVSRVAESQIAAPGPGTVVVADGARRELVLTSPAAPFAASEISSASPGRMLDKGLEGRNSNTARVEQLISPSGPSLSPSARSGSGSAELDVEPHIEVVKLQEPADPRTRIPTEVIEQLQLIESQMAVGGEDQLRVHLRELDRMVQARVSADSILRDMPGVRQARLYLQADEQLADGHADEAMTAFTQVVVIDERAPLALRAALQIADLAYGERANFGQAREYYARCTGPEAARALTAAERRHVEGQLERLRRFSENNWQDLEMLHLVQRGEWSQVVPALGNLIERPPAAPLLPEAARSIAARLEHARLQSDSDIVQQVYNLLAKRVMVEQNEDIRAWLDLALGDILLTHYQDYQQALNRYQRVLSGSSTSGAATLARAKCDQMIERRLNDDMARY